LGELAGEITQECGGDEVAAFLDGGADDGFEEDAGEIGDEHAFIGIGADFGEADFVDGQVDAGEIAAFGEEVEVDLDIADEDFVDLEFSAIFAFFSGD